MVPPRRWGLVTVLVVMLAALQGTAAAQSTTEPSTLYFTTGFESSAWHNGWSRFNLELGNTDLTSDGFSGAALAARVPTSSHVGLKARWRFSNHGIADPTSAYFRYYLRIEPGFSASYSGKLPGFSGIYGGSGHAGVPSTIADPGWSARMMFAPGPRPASSRLGFYTYHLGQRGPYGQPMMFADDKGGVVAHGEWACIEGRIDLNDPGLANGELQGWVNGVSALSRSGLEFRREGEDHIRIREFLLTLHYGGPSPPDRSSGVVIDELAVGSERIGCLGGAEHRLMVDVDGDETPEELIFGGCGNGTCLLATSAGGWDVLYGDLKPSLDTRLVPPVLGDFDGNGIEDVAYRGKCGWGHPCWRVHGGSSTGLMSGAEWSLPREQAMHDLAVLGAPDLTGDGKADIVGLRPDRSGGLTAWWWVSHGDIFAPARNMGTWPLDDTEEVTGADLDGDGDDELLALHTCEGGWCVSALERSGTEFRITSSTWVSLRRPTILAGRFSETTEGVGVIIPCAAARRCVARFEVIGTDLERIGEVTMIATFNPLHVTVVDVDHDGIDDLVWRPDNCPIGEPCHGTLTPTVAGFVHRPPSSPSAPSWLTGLPIAPALHAGSLSGYR